MADNLDDDDMFDLDEPLVSSKRAREDTNDDASDAGSASGAGGAGVRDADGSDEDESGGEGATKKRKVDPEVAQRRKEKRKGKMKLSKSKRKDADVSLDTMLESALPEHQSQVVNTAVMSFFGSTLSDIERESMTLTATDFSLRAEGTLEEVIKGALPGWSSVLSAEKSTKKGKEGAKPIVLVITGAAVRATDLTRELGELRTHKSSTVAKLFGKHFKWGEQAKYLASTPNVRIAIGTPTRLRLLVEKDALSLDWIRLIVFDLKRDAKTRNLFSSNDSKKDVIEFVVRSLIPLARDTTRANPLQFVTIV